MMSEHLTVPPRAAAELCSPVVELRQYTLHQGQRDVLIDIFDSHLVESQEACGMKIIGQFRDLDRPDHFVWLRGFDDMAARKAALEAFYGGPVWAAHKDAANRTMIDSDDVLLLRPVGGGFDLSGKARGMAGQVQPGAMTVATMFHLRPAAEAEFLALFESDVVPLLTRLGAPLLATFITEHAENTFPRLPVRDDVNVFIAFSAFENAEAHGRHQAALAAEPSWVEGVLPRLHRHLAQPIERLRLMPTSRSLL
ncbi:NIPSNAP family protein [Aminobacter ciceronei]|jgi:quinol monooxygenase YgiN|uniref:NIPSNAP family protein n=1 Tax=Aminobacter ciceronei TaxID=150723 RepID=UPI003F6F8447